MVRLAVCYRPLNYDLLSDPESRIEQFKIYNKKGNDKYQDQRERYPEIDIGNAEKTIAESIDHIQNWIGVRYNLPEFGQKFNRIENPTEIGQWSEYEIWNDRYIIKFLGEHAIQESCKGEQYCSQNDDADQDWKVMNG